jgi:hypothetical protein
MLPLKKWDLDNLQSKTLNEPTQLIELRNF